MKFILRLIPLLTMMGWSVYYYIDTLKNGEEAGYLTKPVFYVITVLFVVILRGEFSHWQHNKIKERTLSEKDKGRLEKMLICAGGSAVYLIALPYVGFLLSTTLFLSIGFVWLGVPKCRALLTGLFFSATVYGLFKYALAVPLSNGPWSF